VDAVSLDIGDSEDVLAHTTFLGNNIWGIENLANVEKLPPSGFYLVK